MDTPPLITHRISLHLAQRDATTLTDEIALLRDVFSAEVKQAPMEVHAATLLPMALYLIVSTPLSEDIVARMLRLQAAFKRHAAADVTWLWPVIGPVHGADFDDMVEKTHGMPVEWGLCAEARDWPHSSVHRVPVAMTQ